MSILLIALAIISIFGIRIIVGFNDCFLSKEQTTAIKGVFTVLIFCSHLRGYLHLTSCQGNLLYDFFLNYLGQLIVAAFFFYSGYGIWLSLKTKAGYERTFFKNRILKLLLHFDIAVALYVLVQLFLPIHYSSRQYLLCWIGWESVGNSNWFIFVILSLYLGALAGLYIQKTKGHGGIIAIAILSAALWGCLNLWAKKPYWWYDTIATFPLGMCVAEYKDQIASFLKRREARPVAYSLVLTGFFVLLHHAHGIDIYGLLACVFCLMLLSFSAWIEIGNPILDWLGKNAFTLYIIQRLPMLVLSSFGINQHPILFVTLSILATGLLAQCLSQIYIRFDRLLFNASV